MRNLWIRFQDGRWWWRQPLKAVVLGLTVFAVCYPYPLLFARNVARWRNPNALIDPNAPELRPWIEELRPQLEGLEAGPEALKIVEQFVYQKVKYDWDWNTWGVVDYIPTVAEVFSAGTEDCDGRAVVSASLLRNFGYKADLVSDMTHVWVKTDHGETMSPGRMKKFVEATDQGVRYNWDALGNLPRSLAYGLAVFPLSRELIVVAVLWLLGYRPGMSWRVTLVCLMLMLDGLLIVRYACHDPWRDPQLLGQWFGFANIVAGVVILDAHRRKVRQVVA